MQLSGELSKVNLPNLLQLVKTGRLDGKITLVHGARMATIYIEGGNPIDAELEGISGIDAMMELFLWAFGTFSFEESSPNSHKTRTIAGDDPTFSLEQLLKEGIDYSRKKRFLDEMGITPRTILKPTGRAVSFAREIMALPGVERLDGRKTLADALGDMGLSKVQFINTVASWLLDGLADIAEPPAVEPSGAVELPDWVVARLNQDNPDISQSIIDMVIWVDRVKCWMYQLDADFYRLRKKLDDIDNEPVINPASEAEQSKSIIDSYGAGSFGLGDLSTGKSNSGSTAAAAGIIGSNSSKNIEKEEESDEDASVFAPPGSPDRFDNPYIDVGQPMTFNPLGFGTSSNKNNFLLSGMNFQLDSQIDLDWTGKQPSSSDNQITSGEESEEDY